LGSSAPKKRAIGGRSPRRVDASKEIETSLAVASEASRMGRREGMMITYRTQTTDVLRGRVWVTYVGHTVVSCLEDHRLLEA
jgi:hypothetical protein